MAQKENTTVLYFGDHDGHGVQISDGMADKVQMYSGGKVRFERVGISLEQGEAIGAPKIPLKDVKNLNFDYRRRFGCSYGYEIDALSPAQLSSLIGDAVQSFIGRAPKTFQDNLIRQAEERKKIMEAVQ